MKWRHRVINRTKVVPTMRGNVHVHGMRWRPIGDIYYAFFAASWTTFISVVVVAFLILNTIFAWLYTIVPGGIEHADPESFLDHFFFSVQTLATVGYGYMYPNSTYAHIIVVLESIVGLLSVAMVTGAVFAKFSRPKARVIFSKNAVVTRHEGKETLMLRVANERANYIADASLHATLAIPGTTVEGRSFTRMVDLTLIRHRSPMFFLTWTVLHHINEQSPLHQMDSDTLKHSNAFLVCSLTGYDSTMGQTIHARHIYDAEHLVWNAHFVDILQPSRDGNGVTIDYHNFHSTESDGEYEAV